MNIFQEPTPVFEINDPNSAFPVLAAALDAPCETFTASGTIVMAFQINGEFAEITLDAAEDLGYALIEAVYKARVVERS